jgi:hypothetical protein
MRRRGDFLTVAVDTVRASLRELIAIEQVVLCCFSGSDLHIYEGILGGRRQEGS